MSQAIRLTDEVIEGVMRAIVENDPAVRDNGALGLQYLAAILGVLAVDYPGDDQECRELLDHLAAFSRHVFEDQRKARARRAQPAAEPAVPKGRCIPDPDHPAYGVWKVDRGQD